MVHLRSTHFRILSGGYELKDRREKEKEEGEQEDGKEEGGRSGEEKKDEE